MAGNRCIKNLLKLICLLQNNSINNFPMNEGCIKPFLGPNINSICYNTRVITLYKKNGEIFSSSYIDSNNNPNSSSFFRVSNVTDDCCTLLILSLSSENEYISTNQYVTVNLNCICAIKCLEDVKINNL